MSSPDLLDRGAALLCVIDIQERLAAAMPELADEIFAEIANLLA